MDLGDAELLARNTFAELGIEPDRPPTAFRFARALLGAGSVVVVHALAGPQASTFTIGGKTKIAVSRRLAPPYRNFAVAHETLHWLFRRAEMVFESEEEEERAADFGAACALMPRELVRLCVREHGPKAAKRMAKAICVTQTGWHLREGEVFGHTLAAVSDELVRYRGQLEFNWGGDEAVRRLAAKRKLGVGLKKATPTDQRGRAILIADPDLIAV